MIDNIEKFFVSKNQNYLLSECIETHKLFISKLNEHWHFLVIEITKNCQHHDMKLLTGQIRTLSILGQNYKNGYFLLILFNFIISF